MFTFLHAADLHLDSPMRGLAKHPGAPVEQLRSATRVALASMVDLALESEVDFVVLAGDLYDGDWPDYHTGLYFGAQMQRLKKAGVPVFVVFGNHDAASTITRSLRLPSNVTAFSHKGPTSVRVPGVPVVVHGQSYGRRDETSNLAAGYPNAVPGLFNLGLLHTALEGFAGHATYAPCSVADLRAKAYQYWALGHVHAHTVVSRDPWVVFPGNLQARHVGEPGPKGCVIVEADVHDVLDVRFEVVDAVRWARLSVVAEPEAGAAAVVDSVVSALADAVADADGRPLAARIEVMGSTAAHRELVSETERWTHEVQSGAGGLGDVWLEQVRFRTRPVADLAGMAERDDVLGGLLRRVDALAADPRQLDQMVRSGLSVWDRLPPRLRGVGVDSGEADGVLLTDSALVDALHDARDLLVDRLNGEGDSA